MQKKGGGSTLTKHTPCSERTYLLNLRRNVSQPGTSHMSVCHVVEVNLASPHLLSFDALPLGALSAPVLKSASPAHAVAVIDKDSYPESTSSGPFLLLDHNCASPTSSDDADLKSAVQSCLVSWRKLGFRTVADVQLEKLCCLLDVSSLTRLLFLRLRSRPPHTSKLSLQQLMQQCRTNINGWPFPSIDTM